jgi:hypothetical protein
MTSTEAQRILEHLTRNIPDQLRAIITASGRRHVALKLIPSDAGETWVAFISPGPIASSRTPEEAIAALAEKVKK